MEPKNIVIACGGTGGHLFPGLAVAEELQRRGHRLLIIKSEKRIDEIATQGRDEFEYATLPAVGFPGLSPRLPVFAWKLFNGWHRCRQIYADFQPNAVLGMGGFTSTVPLVVGKQSRAVTLVHESNAIPGKANKLNARFSNVVMLGLEEAGRHFKQGKTRVTGTPVRGALKQPREKQPARRELGLDVGYPVLLITGGSQGAHGLNVALADFVCSRHFPKNRWQVLHLAGENDTPELRERYEQAGIRGKVLEFCDRMDLAFTAGDAVVSRSGASSLAEISYFGLPSLLIPYPYATGDHQTLNAGIPAEQGAAVMLEENETDTDLLARHLLPVLIDDDRRAKMAQAAKNLNPPDAEVIIADEVESLLRHKK
jgi:UDP-N-acetylglucosamine--N-acetylmuramyl-(pentapeptide) pyrophosphoryl-undecaprenol N-acetylglucosamine transferase